MKAVSGGFGLLLVIRGVMSSDNPDGHGRERTPDLGVDENEAVTLGVGPGHRDGISEAL